MRWNALIAAGAALLAGEAGALASSHREAPAISQDQVADNTDVYAFISPTNPDNLVIVANYVPLLLGASGPNFYRFGDSVRYEIHIDNDGDAIKDVTYRYEFRTRVVNGNTFLYNTGAIDSLTDENLNVRQTYRLVKVNEDNGQATVLGNNLPVAPWYVGKRSFPDDSYEGVAQGAIQTIGNVTTFAGPRDEMFFVDLHVFDLLGVGGATTTYGVNVMSIVLEVPITDVAAGGTRPAAGSTEPTGVVGVYASASRRQISILRRARDAEGYGQWTQVSRLAWPLVNEVLIPLKDKDKFNRTRPADDVANFGAYLLSPELPGLLNGVLGLSCAPTPEDGRLDIVGLLSPNETTPADLLRIDITAGQTFDNSGFPNGRTLTDDVTDTELTVLCAMPAEGGGLTPIGDGVDQDDKPPLATFPYMASPHSGNP